MEMNFLCGGAFCVENTCNYLNLLKNIKLCTVATSSEEYLRESTKIFGG